MSGPRTLTIVGAGPAGAATALGARHADPTLDVRLLDRADFPRDKACGDGVAPHVLDLLAGVGVTGLLDDRVPVGTLRLERPGSRGDGPVVERTMARPAYVVPRAVLDARLVAAAQEAGAHLERRRVRSLAELPRDGVVVGADGARSVVRRGLGEPDGPMALAIRGYVPTPPEVRGTQRIVFGVGDAQPTYAWAFDRGDGLANVGYGEPLRAGRTAPSKARMVERLEELLPGCASPGGCPPDTAWVGHHLPLSTAHWRPPAGRVLLVGDAAGLVNPMTGEGIFYAVATGLAAGRAAAEALAAGDPGSAGRRYARATRPLLARHLRHTALAARLTRSGRVLDAGLRASADDQGVFDDLVELGLARGRLTPRLARALTASLLPGPSTRPPTTAHRPQEQP